MRNNNFYLAKKGTYTYFIPNSEWSDGLLNSSAKNAGCLDKIHVSGFSRFSFTLVPYRYIQACQYDFFDSGNFKIKSLRIEYAQNSKKNQNSINYTVNVPAEADYITVTAYFISDFDITQIANSTVNYLRMRAVVPYYQSLNIKAEKSNGQMFFRNSLDGKIILYNDDYSYVASSGIETEFGFYLYRKTDLLVSSKFNKTDCTFDDDKMSVELALSVDDQYSKILESYDKTYDLLKIGVGKTKVEMQKRAIVQIYILGENTVSNYCAGTVYEHEVIEPVSSLNTLQTKYHFGESEIFRELSLSGFNYDINASIILAGGSDKISAITGNQQFHIAFEKVADRGSTIFLSSSSNYADYVLLSDDRSPAVTIIKQDDFGVIEEIKCNYDLYKIRVYTSASGTLALYESVKFYGNDNNFALAADGAYAYRMQFIEPPSPYVTPSPREFYLGSMIIKREICMRLLSDTAISVDDKVNLYPLQPDDFAIEKANYRYCIGLNFRDDDGGRVVYIKANDKYSTTPTEYGLMEQGTYFTQPKIYGLSSYLYPYPLAKSTWGNASLWVGFEEFVNPITGQPSGVEKLVRRFSKRFYHKDAMEVGDIIRALLAQIDPTIVFECTEDFSQFLYGSVNIGTSSYKQTILLTQKSNILKGEYDQAAQRAEITLKQILDMMRDCYKCFWFIDEQNRLRLEHISFFMNGLSYSPQLNTVLDLTVEKDKFNKKLITKGQKKISYLKSDLSSRYEFNWADGPISEAMGGGFTADILSKYVQPDKIENINLQNVSSDLDMMFYKPDEFSADGFALLSVDSDKKVPIEKVEYYRGNNDISIITFVQNAYASFIKLFENYLYDLPASTVKSSVDSTTTNRYTSKGLKRSMEQDLEIQTGSMLSPYTPIKSNFGVGFIEAIKFNIDTLASNVSLRYEPK